MANDPGHSPEMPLGAEVSGEPEIDLDKTDRLPILEGTLYDSDVADDAVPLDYTDVLNAVPARSLSARVDLPSLAESVRSVEERISRQHAEFESLGQAFERARDAESASTARAHALAADLASARTALESEQSRSREIERALFERSTALESARSRIEQALRESEHHQSEAQTLRESLAAREASIAQVQHSLGERDAQLSALQQEHAKVVPELEATAKSTAQLAADLQAARADAKALAAELQASRDTVSALNAQAKRRDSDAIIVQSDLRAARLQADSHLDLLRTREWRRGFDANLFREMDVQAGVAQAGHGALESERARLHGQVAALQAQLSAHKTQSENERTRLAADLTASEQALQQMREQAWQQTRMQETAEAPQVPELREAATLREAEQTTHIAQLRAEHEAQVAQLQSEAEARAQEKMSSLAELQAQLQGQLHEARQPLLSSEAEVKRLTEELAAKNTAALELDEENSRLRATLERTRSTLVEREFIIRRLERNESNNANALGRIQNNIERLRSVPVTPVGAADVETAAPPAPDRAAELIRIDGGRSVTFVLARRTRIGRAVGCDLQIEAGSVSRHHALIVVGPRDTIIEDLNSTNGVLVNGRKVTRHVLSDGDALTIGETQFRYFVRPVQGAPGSKPVQPTA